MKMKELKELAAKKQKKIVFNRGIGGYQVVAGFTSSEVEYPFYKSGKPMLEDAQIKRLASYL